MAVATRFGIPVDNAPGWDGAVAHLIDPSGQTHAWLVDDPTDGIVGYIQGAPDTEGTLQVANPQSWASIADSLGLVELPSVAANDNEQPPATDAPAADAPASEGKAAAVGQAAAPADLEEQSGIMIALIVPEGDAADIALTDVPTALPPTELHMTLAFLGATDAVADEGAYYSQVLDALRDVAAEYDPITGTISGIGRFTSPDGSDAFYYSYDAPELPDLRHDIVQALTDAGIDVSREHGFTPHVTVCYLKQGEDNPIRRAESKVLTFGAVTFCFGDQRLNIRLGGADPAEEDLAALALHASLPGYVESTAPSAMLDNNGSYKAMPPAANTTKDGTNKVNKRKGPPIAAGSWVSFGNQRGRVDLVVTNGKVPGVQEDITGTPDKPAARVIVYQQTGGAWNATGRKVGVAASSLKHTFPLTGGQKKDLDPEAALVDLFTAYYEAHDGTGPYVDPVAVKTVYERGLESWPGEDVIDVPREHWALGRTKAFLTVAAGGEVKGYNADEDLLPRSDEQPAAEDTESPATEGKAAVTVAEVETLDAQSIEDVLAGLREVLDSPVP